MLQIALWVLGYFIYLTFAKVLKAKGKEDININFIASAGLVFWPLFLGMSIVEHGSDYLSQLLAGSSKVRVTVDAENEQLKAENKFLSEELVEAQQKLSVLDGYRNHR